MINLLMNYKLQAISFAAVLLVLGGTFAYGYHRGSIAEIKKITEKTAETQEKLFDLTSIIRMQSDELRRINREKEDLVNELEKKALSAEGSSNPGISSTGGLLRLKDRWGKSSTSTQ